MSASVWRAGFWASIALSRKIPKQPEAALTADIIALATQDGRYGYRRIAALLREAGRRVNKKRVERIWRREGLKVPQQQPKRGRLWLKDGPCIRLRDELLKGEIFDTLQEAKVIIASGRRHYNTVRPHSSLGYRPPAPEVVVHASTLAPQPTLNYHHTRITHMGQATMAAAVAVSAVG